MRKAIVFVLLLATYEGYSQKHKAQGSSCVQTETTIPNRQCTSCGIGNGKDTVEAKTVAERNRLKALQIAHKKGSYSFTDATGSGSATCIPVKKITSQQSK